MGYAGAQLGTRFIATTECRTSEAYKRAILEADEADIVLTERITGVPVAVINTPFVRRTGTKAGSLARFLLRGRRTKHWMRTIYALRSLWQLKRGLMKEGAVDDYWQAGKSVAGIDKVEPAGEIVRSALRGRPHFFLNFFRSLSATLAASRTASTWSLRAAFSGASASRLPTLPRAKAADRRTCHSLSWSAVIRAGAATLAPGPDVAEGLRRVLPDVPVGILQGFGQGRRGVLGGRADLPEDPRRGRPFRGLLALQRDLQPAHVAAAVLRRPTRPRGHPTEQAQHAELHRSPSRSPGCGGGT